MKDTKLAIVGIGLIGKRHAQAIWKNGIKLIAIADPSSEGKAFAIENSLPYFKDLDTLLSESNPDGIIIATPTTLHLEQSLKCIEHRIPILIEKPITVTVAEGKIITQAAKKNGVPVLVGHHRRHNPIIQKARKIITSGKIGKIRAVTSTCWFYKPDNYFDKSPWRKEDGAGPISVNLIHDVDCLRYLCGEVIHVHAQKTKSYRGYHNEDTAVALLTFADGALGTLTISDSIVSPWSWEMTSQEYPIYPPTGKSCYHIGGSKGSLSVPDLTVWNYIGERDWWRPLNAEFTTKENSDPLINQISHFCKVIQGEKPLISAEDAVKSLEIIEKIKNSS